MRRLSTSGLALLSAVFLACGGGDSTGPAAYENVAGTYDGDLIGVSQGVALSATFSITLTQNGGSLGGSYAITGTLYDGFVYVDIAGTGTLTGNVASGNNPSVNLTVRPGSCPTRTATFSGTYDSANRRLTMTGPVQIFDAQCVVFLTYHTTFVLER